MFSSKTTTTGKKYFIFYLSIKILFARAEGRTEGGNGLPAEGGTQLGALSQDPRIMI